MSTKRIRQGAIGVAAFSALFSGVFVPSASSACLRAPGSEGFCAVSTNTTLGANPTSALVGADVTFDVEVEPFYPPLTSGPSNESPPVMEGEVDIVANGDTLGTITVDEDGKGSLTTDELAAGTYDVVAEYQGGAEGYFEPSDSEPVEVTITAPPTPPTTTTTTTVAPAPGPSGAYETANGETNTLTVTSGGKIPVVGSGWMAGTDVEVWLHSDPVLLGVATAGGTGAFSTVYNVPTGAALGKHEVRMTGLGANGQPSVVTLDLTIVAPAAAGAAKAAPAPSKLAFTG